MPDNVQVAVHANRLSNVKDVVATQHFEAFHQQWCAWALCHLTKYTQMPQLCRAQRSLEFEVHGDGEEDKQILAYVLFRASKDAPRQLAAINYRFSHNRDTGEGSTRRLSWLAQELWPGL